MLQGKGMIVWQIQKTDGGQAQRIAQAAVSAGLMHVAIKVADGANMYPGDAQGEAMITAAMAALKAAGIEVWGWQFVYGRNPRNTAERIAQAEADVAVQRIHAFELGGFIVDFENSGHPLFTYRGDAEDARVYMERIRQGAAGVTLAGASHRFPNVHGNLPWDAFMNRCDVAMPQMYWVQGEPEPNLDESVRQYRSRWPFLIYVPIGSAYGEGGWSATPDQVTRFMQHARTHNLSAVSFWSWQAARNTPLWDAVARFHWSDTRRPHPPQERSVWVIAPAGLKFRSQPDLSDATWIDRIVFSEGMQLVALGEPTPPGAGSYRWQHVRAPDGREGWVAYGIGAERYLSDVPPADTERPVWVAAPLGLRFRRQPSTTSEWIDQTVFATGTQLTGIGIPTQPDIQGYRWQQVRTPDGRIGWVAHGLGSELYVTEQPPVRTITTIAPSGIRFRRQPSTSAEWIERIVFMPGTRLSAIGQPSAPDGQSIRWQQVRTSDGRQGWIAYSEGNQLYVSE